MENQNTQKPEITENTYPLSLFLENLSVFTSLNRQADTDKECLYTEQHRMLKWVLKQYGIYRWTTAENIDYEQVLSQNFWYSTQYHKFHELYS